MKDLVEYEYKMPSFRTNSLCEFLSLWALLLARDLDYPLSIDPPNKIFGVELYSPYFFQRENQ